MYEIVMYGSTAVCVVCIINIIYKAMTGKLKKKK